LNIWLLSYALSVGACYVLSIAMMDVNCELVLVLKERVEQFSSNFLNPKK